MCVRALVCAHQKRLAGMNRGGPCALTAALGGTALFRDMPSKGPCCNSNIISIRFVGLNCQERMISTTRQGAIKGKHAADCSRRLFLFFLFFLELLGQSGPRYHAAAETACRIRKKLNANGDGI